jgi:hypothetical protein
MIYISNHTLLFYAGPKQFKECLQEELLFSKAHFIYYNFFTAKTEIKS